MMNKVVYFEMPYSDKERARHFYEHIFGWRITANNMDGDIEYNMAYTGPTDDKDMPEEAGFINGGMMPKNDMVKGPVVAVHVEDIDETIEMVVEHGGEKLMDPMDVGDMGHYAYVKDTEGNIVGIWQDRK